MKKRLILLALALLVAVPGMAKSQIVRDSLQSVVLGRAVKYNVYVPDGFDRSDKAYPVVYLLHGLYGNNEDWEQRGQMKTVLPPPPIDRPMMARRPLVPPQRYFCSALGINSPKKKSS